ncbi:MAG: FecR family protein [Treponema sp.]|jgi:hypothetical protein|nr:FecR family protein [Treponema sp.]
MKKARGLIAGLLMALGGFGLCAQETYIRDCAGTVEVKEAGTAVWVKAEAGQRIGGDTVISTGFKSTAFIALGNSVVQVHPLTRLTLEEIRRTQGEEEITLHIRTGKIRADVNPPLGGKTNFTVRSPVATASVRGTSFEFDGVNLKVDQGLVHVTGGDNSGVYVGAGHSAAPDPETGRVTGAMESAKAELIPVIAEAAAAAESILEAAAIMPEAGPGAGPAGFGFSWE